MHVGSMLLGGKVHAGQFVQAFHHTSKPDPQPNFPSCPCYYGAKSTGNSIVGSSKWGNHTTFSTTAGLVGMSTDSARCPSFFITVPDCINLLGAYAYAVVGRVVRGFYDFHELMSTTGRPQCPCPYRARKVMNVHLTA